MAYSNHFVSKAQMKALVAADSRTTGCVCPVRGVHAAAETALLKALLKRGLITNTCAPRITDTGRELVRQRNQPQ